jgi:hypothetical protein
VRAWREGALSTRINVAPLHRLTPAATKGGVAAEKSASVAAPVRAWRAWHPSQRSAI